MIIKGSVHTFGDNVNTDDIIAAQYLDSQDETFLGAKCMENIDPGFVKRVKRGDIIVGGVNFGCGSSREHAPVSLKGCGIALVIAPSFARIFYRNCINVGLPILVCEEPQNLHSGDQLAVDLKKGLIHNITSGITLQSEKFPDFMQEIIKAKGLINWIKRRNR